MEKKVIENLINEAIKAREKSYSPYSHYSVGAALLTKKNNIYSGCNIENAAYGCSICAERCAIFKAVSNEEKEFLAIAIVGGTHENGITNFAEPCGSCRQVMSEFCDKNEFNIILATNENNYVIYTLDELLPHSFVNEGHLSDK